jgi:polyphosphate kinase 2 (PPK2 family)
MPANVLDKPGRKVRLEEISADPPKGMTRETAEKRFVTLGKELFELQEAMYAAKVTSVLVVLQGRDGAGKDGTIKHVVGCLDPRGVAVTPFGVPTPEELGHDFLWRIHRHAPRLGEFAIFNRSHYEDVLVARVHDLVPRPTWKERYGHIRDFEELLAEHGAVVLKYFLHITKGEQEQRLLEREKSPGTAWKLNPNDWIATLLSPNPSSTRSSAAAAIGTGPSRTWGRRAEPSSALTARRRQPQRERRASGGDQSNPRKPAAGIRRAARLRPTSQHCSRRYSSTRGEPPAP